MLLESGTRDPRSRTGDGDFGLSRFAMAAAPQLSGRLTTVASILDLLQEMPTPDPSPDLLGRTLNAIDDTRRTYSDRDDWNRDFSGIQSIPPA